MRWDRFFEDLEDQLASEWEAERAALDTEAERLRLSRVTLRERLAALALVPDAEAEPVLDLADGTILAGRVAACGLDWIAVEPTGPHAGAHIVPLAAVRSIGLAHVDLLRTARPPATERRARLADRMGLGFVLRDAARRRTAVTVHLLGDRALSGTIDRAGADHLDLALHEPRVPRRGSELAGHRIVPFAAIARVRLEGRPDVAYG